MMIKGNPEALAKYLAKKNAALAKSAPNRKAEAKAKAAANAAAAK